LVPFSHPLLRLCGHEQYFAPAARATRSDQYRELNIVSQSACVPFPYRKAVLVGLYRKKN